MRAYKVKKATKTPKVCHRISRQQNKAHAPWPNFAEMKPGQCFDVSGRWGPAAIMAAKRSTPSKRATGRFTYTSLPNGKKRITRI